MGGTGYEVHNCSMVLDVSKKYHCHIYWLLEQLELAQSL